MPSKLHTPAALPIPLQNSVADCPYRGRRQHAYPRFHRPLLRRHLHRIHQPANLPPEPRCQRRRVQGILRQRDHRPFHRTGWWVFLLLLVVIGGVHCIIQRGIHRKVTCLMRRKSVRWETKNSIDAPRGLYYQTRTTLSDSPRSPSRTRRIPSTRTKPSPPCSTSSP